MGARSPSPQTTGWTAPSRDRPGGRTVGTVKPTVNDGAAFRTKQPGPARWITTLRHRRVAFDLFFPGLAGAVDGEELDRAPNGTQRLHLVEDLGRDGLGVEPASSSTSIVGVVAATKRSRPPWTTIRPQVPAAMLWARRRPAGMVRSSQTGPLRTQRSPSGSSARSQSGQSSGVPSRSNRPSESSTQARSWNGGLWRTC